MFSNYTLNCVFLTEIKYTVGINLIKLLTDSTFNQFCELQPCYEIVLLSSEILAFIVQHKVQHVQHVITVGLILANLISYILKKNARIGY